MQREKIGNDDDDSRRYLELTKLYQIVYEPTDQNDVYNDGHRRIVEKNLVNTTTNSIEIDSYANNRDETLHNQASFLINHQSDVQSMPIQSESQIESASLAKYRSVHSTLLCNRSPSMTSSSSLVIGHNGDNEIHYFYNQNPIIQNVGFLLLCKQNLSVCLLESKSI